MQREENHMKVEFDAISENESLSRMILGAFMVTFNPTVEEIEDVKTAVCEAVTNCVIHGYEGQGGTIYMELTRVERELTVVVEDHGVGIENIEKAMEPMYTTKPELERSGLGFTFIEAFMDEVQVESEKGKWTRVYMKKILNTPFEKG